MTIIQASHTHRQAIIDLLVAENLPVDDLPAHLDHFFVVVKNGEVVGAIGLEVYSSFGLLRSMVVRKDHRNEQIAARLIGHLEKHAANLQIDALYLLTETATDYFNRKHFQPIARTEVPEAIKQSTEFSSVCAVTAVVMYKSLSSIQ